MARASRRYELPAAAAVGLVVGLALVGCGTSDDGRPDLLVSAATSLKRALSDYGDGFRAANVQLSFAGSDELAAQIRSGAGPDVFAAADEKLTGRLFAEGLVEQPLVFAGNRLVLATAAADPGIDSLDDLEQPGVTIAIGSEDVPVGSYARRLLARLDPARRKAILANVRSHEPDAGGISAKLTQGAVEAGFLYATDVEATNGRLRAIELPPDLQPQVRYAVAIVKGARQRQIAQDFVEGLLQGAGARDLRAAGFRPAPPAR